MKSLWIASFLLLFWIPSVVAQSDKELSPGYYVVVGAYSQNREDAAQKFTDDLRQKGVQAKYGFNSSKNLYFVYLEFTTERKPAINEMYATRKSAEFPDAWVRVVKGTPSMLAQVTEVKEETHSPVDSPDTTKTIDAVQPAEQITVTDPVAEPATVVTVAQEAQPTVETKPIEVVYQPEPLPINFTEVFLSLFNARNNKIVEGKVKVVDTERNKLLMEVDGNDYLTVPNPEGTSGKLTLLCESFGYRKVQQQIDYPMSLADTVKENVELLGTTFILYFDLVRYLTGDKTTLYNVYFFNDAAVMLPESKFELTSLLQMMKENPDYRIRLHGHTNGNYHGKIIKMGSSQNFFSLDGSVNTIGSAKDLSYERAEVIKDYLVANDVKPDRIEVKAWGGKKPIYDKHSANARRNVRVEVEILEE